MPNAFWIGFFAGLFIGLACTLGFAIAFRKFHKALADELEVLQGRQAEIQHLIDQMEWKERWTKN